MGTVISLDTSLPQLATVTMRLSFSVSEETVCEVGLAVETGLDTGLSAQGCTKSGILVKGLPANQRVGSHFLAGTQSLPAKSNIQPASIITAG